MFRSLGLRSDLVVMEGLCTLETAVDHIVMRTPEQPHYWHGNTVTVTDPDADPRAALGWFEAAFPDATHVVIKWDTPGPKVATLQAAFADTALEVATFDVLTAGAVLPAAPPTRVVCRPLNGADWDGLLELQCDVAAEDGYDPVTHRPYLAQRNAQRRMQIARGSGQWFGAFEGDLIVGTMGAFHGHVIATIDAVETRASHRRRGICSALLHVAGTWLNGVAPGAPIVIIAEAGEAPGRLYCARGFAHAETIVEVEKPGY